MLSLKKILETTGVVKNIDMAYQVVDEFCSHAIQQHAGRTEDYDKGYVTAMNDVKNYIKFRNTGIMKHDV